MITVLCTVLYCTVLYCAVLSLLYILLYEDIKVTDLLFQKYYPLFLLYNILHTILYTVVYTVMYIVLDCSLPPKYVMDPSRRKPDTVDCVLTGQGPNPAEGTYAAKLRHLLMDLIVFDVT